MSRLLDVLRIVFNRFSFIFIPGALFLAVACRLGVNGFTLLDGAIIAALIVVLVALWWRFHARQSPNVPATGGELLNDISRSGKFAMLAFESEFCLGSTTLGLRLTELEQKYPDKFQVYSISILKEPGKQLFAQFARRVTPTYVLLDDKGQVVMDFPLVLPVERVIYTVSQRQLVR